MHIKPSSALYGQAPALINDSMNRYERSLTLVTNTSEAKQEHFIHTAHFTHKVKVFYIRHELPFNGVISHVFLSFKVTIRNFYFELILATLCFDEHHFFVS